MTFSTILIVLERLGGRAFCSVSPARCAVSSLTCAKRPAAQTLTEVFDV
jgi:hypothetical protein